MTEKIILELNASSGSNILSIGNITPYQKLGYRVLNESLEIKNLKMTSFIESLAPVPFPVFPLEASETETQIEIFNLEWNSPRIVLELLTKYIEDNEWQRISVYSLLNVLPLPYREFNAGDYVLGHNSQLGVKITNVGHGLLTGNDRVLVLGELIRKVELEKISSGLVVNGDLLSNQVKQVLAENFNRKGITIFNNGNVDIFLDIVPTVSPTQFLTKIPAQSFYESSFGFTDSVYLLAVGNTSVNIREF
ncbi:hypothetical protein [Nodularia sphaerocarpa]|uniref:hypothetical protein n=1 Tax=Nodularia sphaerocarpa TaxID=137816 RepID=UPI001EFBAE71|nr:hypothetical protein [Nodularia sphaerocarpa]MDB9375758.1 hypothetical protein [Nodularia sphaerocarpa CS-585]MDB9379952.1 hypothetical protein [Nodularia sphaerocarpa CS-585A2]